MRNRKISDAVQSAAGQVSEHEQKTTHENKARPISDVELEIARLLLESAMDLLAREHSRNASKEVAQEPARAGKK